MLKTGMTGIAAVAVTAGAAIAGGGDYGLLVQGGQVVTGIGDHTDQVITEIGERVFAADLADNGTFWAAEEPGIFIQEGSLPDNTQVGFVIEAALLSWDGVGPVNFSLSPDAMTLEFGPNSVTTPAVDGDVTGFTINYDADTVGGFDEHYDFLLDNTAATGIYVIQKRFTLSGFADSESTWTVFNAGLDEATHDAAIEWVEANLVPAPGAMGLLALGGLAATRRRR
ncbi:MAG: hypothetical protein RIB60_02070 [Phycisphaerales bacterium]